MDISDEQVREISRWAESTPNVSEVRLFGSRAKGTATSASDVDLAVTTVEAPRRMDAYTVFFFGKLEWQAHLTAALGIEVHVERYDAETSPTVFQSCQECSVVLWQQHPTN